MMETLRGWLLGLTAAALAVSLLTAMLPKGETIRRIAGLAGGLILLLAGLLLLLLPTGKSSGQERQTSDDTQLYSLEETEQRMAQLLGSMSGVGRVQVMLTLKTGPTLQLAQDMDLEQEEGSLRQRSQPVTVNRGSGWQEALVTRQDYPVYQGAVVVCQGAGSSAVRLAVTEAVAALTGLSTEKITVVQWEQ